MSIYYDRKLELEKHEFQLGPERGRLAVTLDVLTDALILIGQHGVYCRTSQNPRNPELPALDLQRVMADIDGAKQLVSDVLQQLTAQARKAEGPAS
ncbi:MAG: hypothetical protein M3R43_08675 [Acidobacteriota bacterium]|nr:hypothetical protein [Acidobacteriota bacterium]